MQTVGVPGLHTADLSLKLLSCTYIQSMSIKRIHHHQFESSSRHHHIWNFASPYIICSWWGLLFISLQLFNRSYKHLLGTFGERSFSMWQSKWMHFCNGRFFIMMSESVRQEVTWVCCGEEYQGLHLKFHFVIVHFYCCEFPPRLWITFTSRGKTFPSSHNFSLLCVTMFWMSRRGIATKLFILTWTTTVTPCILATWHICTTVFHQSYTSDVAPLLTCVRSNHLQNISNLSVFLVGDRVN